MYSVGRRLFVTFFTRRRVWSRSSSGCGRRYRVGSGRTHTGLVDVPTLVAALPGSTCLLQRLTRRIDLQVFSKEDVTKRMAERDVTEDRVTKLQGYRREADS